MKIGGEEVTDEEARKRLKALHKKLNKRIVGRLMYFIGWILFWLGIGVAIGSLLRGINVGR